jgi:hypothetical protein
MRWMLKWRMEGKQSYVVIRKVEVGQGGQWLKIVMHRSMA